MNQLKSDRDRILLVHPFVANVCGPDQSLYGLVQQLASQDYSFYIAVPLINEVVAKYSKYVEETVINLNAGYYHHYQYFRSNLMLFLRNLVSYPTIRKHLKELRIDLVHSNIESSWVYGLAARSLGIPSIVHLRGLTTVGTRMGKKFMPSILHRCADHVIAVSQPVAEAFQRAGLPGERISVVDNGVDVDRFRPRSGESRENLLDGRYVIGAVGSADPRKGWHNLVAACAILKVKYPRLRCLFIGEMDAGDRIYRQGRTYRQELLHLVDDQDLQGIVQFAGVQDDMPEVYAGLDLLVQPSVIEAGPRAPIEAMACGIPVVATHVGGNSDYIRDGLTGVLCPPEDTAALAQGIDRLLSDPELRCKMGREGRRIALERFSLQTHAHKVAAIYQQLLHRG